MLQVSELTGKTYESEDAVFFRNLYQSCFYIKHNIMPIDLFCDSKDKLVMVFDRQQHNSIIGLWMENKEKQNEEVI